VTHAHTWASYSAVYRICSLSNRPLPYVTLGHKSLTPYRNYVTSLQPSFLQKGSDCIACRNKSDFSFLISTSAVNVMLLAFAAECHAVTSAASPLVMYARRSAANLPHIRLWSNDGTDRRTDAKSCHNVIGSAPYAVRAVSVTEEKTVDMISTIFIL